MSVVCQFLNSRQEPLSLNVDHFLVCMIRCIDKFEIIFKQISMDLLNEYRSFSFQIFIIISL